MKNEDKSSNYYNVSITGFGYINNICEVNPSGKPYLICDIALLSGELKRDYSTLDKTYFKATVVGSKVKAAFRKHFNADGFIKSPKVPVTALVRLSGLEAETFTFQNGERAGQTGISLNTRLLGITWLKIGNKVVDG